MMEDEAYGDAKFNSFGVIRVSYKSLINAKVCFALYILFSLN